MRLASATLLLAQATLGEGASDRVESLIAKMTVAEKAGQLGVFSRPGGSDYNPGTNSSDFNSTLQLIRDGQVSSLYNGAGVETNQYLQKVAVEESRLGIPLIFGADIWHGMRTIFPIPLAEAASWEPALGYQTTRATAVEGTASGISWTYAPMVDVARDQRWGRVSEGAGEDPFLGGAFAASRVKGFQGDDLTSDDSMVACLKHFAGYGGVAAGLDYSPAETSEATFRDVFLPPFEAGLQAGSLSVMSAFVAIVGGVPASGSHWLMTDVLRGELKFDGFVVSDYEADIELVDWGFAANNSHAAQIGLTAGVDMSMQSGAYRDHLPSLVAEGKVSMDTLDEGVRRILSAKERMGLLDNPYRSLDSEREKQDQFIPEHDTLALDVARRSMVLLKNEKDVLPLSKSGQKVALIGWWGEDQENAEGCGVIWGNHTYVVTLAAGISGAMEDPSLLRTVQGSGYETPIDGGIDDSVEAAQWADVVVLALGEPKVYSGESESRTDIVIPDAQQKLAEAVAATGTPVVVVLKNGRALALDGAVRDANAIVVSWFLGKKSGAAIADVLFGDYSPSGRLPVSFPQRSGQQPFFYNHMNSGRPCGGRREQWKNCWREITNMALYPFGHGLTYTTFEYSMPTISPASGMEWDGAINISATLTNTGNRAGEEVVQLYVHDRVASRVRPVRELKGFQKVLLQAGESQTVTFPLQRGAVAFTSADNSKKEAEPGMFDIWVTSSATAGDAGEFELFAPRCESTQARSEFAI